MEYIPVAVRTQILFFCVSDLANVDPMYQYSLEWFLNIFLSGIANSERAGSPGTGAHVDTDTRLPPAQMWHTWTHCHSECTHMDSYVHLYTPLSNSHYVRTHMPLLPSSEPYFQEF